MGKALDALRPRGRIAKGRIEQSAWVRSGAKGKGGELLRVRTAYETKKGKYCLQHFKTSEKAQNQSSF